jgi:hypothetical protein
VERRRSFLTGWRLDAAREMRAFQLANILAAEAVQRLSLARRLALLDALQSADRPLLAAELMGRVEARLGSGCWGHSPKRALHDDIRRLKAADCIIHYRRGQPPGYLWGSWHGAVDPEAVRQRIEPADPVYIKAVARLTPREKLERADGMVKWAQTLHGEPS